MQERARHSVDPQIACMEQAICSMQDLFESYAFLEVPLCATHTHFSVSRILTQMEKQQVSNHSITYIHTTKVCLTLYYLYYYHTQGGQHEQSVKAALILCS